MTFKRIGLPALSGILYALSFPPFDFYALSWIAFMPLFIAIKQEKPRTAFYLGWWGGLVGSLILLYWVTISMANYGGLPWLATVPVLILLTAYVAIYWAGFSALWVFLRTQSNLPDVLLAPILWVSLEWIRGHALTGFPWGLLGYSQYLNLSIIQVADLTGVYGVSFLIILVNSSITLIPGLMHRTDRSQAVQALSLVVITVILAWGYGRLRLDQIPNAPGQRLKVGIVQGNVPQDVKWDASFRQRTLQKYAGLSEDLAELNPDLIVWPEAAMPFIYENGRHFNQQVQDIARLTNSPILFGSLARTHDSKNKVWLSNSAFLIEPSGNTLSRYDKIHLVPFGEYVPLSSIFFFIDKLVDGIGNFKPGNRYTILTLPSETSPPTQFGVVICFELIFPDSNS